MTTKTTKTIENLDTVTAALRKILEVEAYELWPLSKRDAQTIKDAKHAAMKALVELGITSGDPEVASKKPVAIDSTWQGYKVVDLKMAIAAWNEAHPKYTVHMPTTDDGILFSTKNAGSSNVGAKVPWHAWEDKLRESQNLRRPDEADYQNVLN